MANYSRSTGSNGQGRSNPGYDPFSSLTPLSSSNTNSRSITPANARPTDTNQASGVDAFSSLLGSSFSSSSSANGSNMSLADRKKAAQKDLSAKAAQVAATREKDASVWSGLDMMGQAIPVAQSSIQASQVEPDDWVFDKIQSQPKASSPAKLAPQTSKGLDDDWGLGDFGAPATTTKTPSSSKSNVVSADLFDSFDDVNTISDPFDSIKGTSVPHTLERDDDDVLGLLGKPVDAIPKVQAEPQRNIRPSQRTDSIARATSPPPHIIGQIVEMGFTPQQARLALASTDSGLDVQQALDTLLANGVGSSSMGDNDESEGDGERPPRGLAEFQDEDNFQEEGRRREAQRRRPQVQRQGSSSNRPDRPATESPSLLSEEMQERADKLLAQASTIGLNVFNKANAFWKDGKDKVQKVYEERAGKAKPPSDGRPRWMTEVPDDEHQPGSKFVGGLSFQDDEEGQASPQTGRRPQASAPPPPSRKAATSLFDDGPSTYISPARRRPAASRSGSQPGPSPSPAPRLVPDPPALRIREAVSAGAGAIASSNQRKVKGTELYKLGQYANAEQEYTAAMSSLPSNHLFMIPLLNNRAIARIKTGDHGAAADDCTAAISIIGTDYHPAKEAKVTREDEGASVDLADALVKAYRRRAEAHEGREKWDLALKDWEAVIKCDWSVKMRSDALAGAGRCRKMLNAEKAPAPRKAASAPPRPRAIVTPQNFAAVRELKAANAAQEKEEQLKMDLKDSVEGRLASWKGGKETNIRALIASLDTVLWPELNWQKVGLHELVTPSQVKIRYMKAIAKLHPDKLSTATTTEQRMIANGVFGTLNEAYAGFKQ